MTPELIIQLVDLAIALAQTQFAKGDAANLLAGIVQRGQTAYQAHTGQPLDPSLIKAENPI